MSTVAFIIPKWKKFGTTRTPPRPGHPAKRSDQRRRALVREVTKNPMATLAELHQSQLNSRVARQKPLLRKSLQMSS